MQASHDWYSDAQAHVALAIQFVAAADASTKAGKPGGQSLSGWEQLAQVLLMTNEFMFVD